MPRPVPSITQYASPSLIAAISYEGHPRTCDPRWPETGAPGAPDGLIYQPFARYVRAEHGLDAQVVADLDTARLLAELDCDSLVIASVHPEIRRPDKPPEQAGGHLVLVTGHADGRITFHDPAGHTPSARVASLSTEVFDGFAAHRGIVFPS